MTSDQAEHVKRMRVEAYEDEIASLLEDNCLLGETIKKYKRLKSSVCVI